MKKTRRSSAPKNPSAKRQKLLQAVLAHVPFEGWTEAAYAQGMKQAGIARADADRLFPEGIRDVIDAFGEEADQAMQARIEAERGFARFRARDKIAFTVRARLEFFTPYREAMRRLMLWHALPLNMASGIRRIAKTADLMWRAAGDTSTDYNFYTKRLLLGAVLKATMLFWIGDETPDSRATWDFLDRRIGDVLKLGKSLSLLKEFTPEEIVGFVRRKAGFPRTNA